jgi:hypothetical protein
MTCSKPLVAGTKVDRSVSLRQKHTLESKLQSDQVKMSDIKKPFDTDSLGYLVVYWQGCLLARQ